MFFAHDFAPMCVSGRKGIAIWVKGRRKPERGSGRSQIKQSVQRVPIHHSQIFRDEWDHSRFEDFGEKPDAKS
jgi:hypothetical protein